MRWVPLFRLPLPSNVHNSLPHLPFPLSKTISLFAHSPTPLSHFNQLNAMSTPQVSVLTTVCAHSVLVGFAFNRSLAYFLMRVPASAMSLQSFPDTILNIRKSHTKIYNASKNEDPTHDDDDVDVQQPRLFSSFYSGGYTSTSPIEQARRIRRASHSLVASNLATKYPNIDTDEDAVRIIGERQAELFPPHLGLPRRLPARHRECQLGDAEMHQQALLDAQGCCEGWYQVEMRLEFRPRIQIDVVLPQDLPRELLTRRRPFILIDGIEGEFGTKLINIDARSLSSSLHLFTSPFLLLMKPMYVNS